MDEVTKTVYYPERDPACTSRLPCGVCFILGKMCPKLSVSQAAYKDNFVYTGTPLYPEAMYAHGFTPDCD